MDKVRKIVVLFMIAFCIVINSSGQEKMTQTANVYEVDSLFIAQLDSVIFHPICPFFNKKNENYNKFHILGSVNRDNIYSLEIILLEYIDRIKQTVNLVGCFEHKGYLYIMYGDIPPEVITKTEKKMKINIFTFNLPRIDDRSPIWGIEYKNGQIRLTSIYCGP